MLYALIDAQGFSIILGSIAAFIIAVGGFVMQAITFARQAREHVANQRREEQSLARDKTLDTIKANVNGLNDKIAASSKAEGKAEGILIGAGAVAAGVGDKP